MHIPTTLVAIIHILTAIFLIGLVLVQDSEGAMGSSFGGSGSSNSILGPTGAPNFLVKATRWLAVIFALTSLFLTKVSSERSKSALDDLPVATSTANPGTGEAVEKAPTQTTPEASRNQTPPANEKAPQ